MNKKARAFTNKWSMWSLLIILAVVLIFTFLSVAYENWTENQGKFVSNDGSKVSYLNTWKTYGLSGVSSRLGYVLGDFLGFDTCHEATSFWPSFSEGESFLWCKIKTGGIFLWNLFIGFLAGLWIYLVYVISKVFNRLVKTTLKSQWIHLMGGQVWKIIAIAVGYAVLMSVPVVNKFIEIITFQIKPFNVNWFILSLILAFYIGFGPAWIESYQKYNLRIKAEKAIIAAQSRARLERTSLK